MRSASLRKPKDTDESGRVGRELVLVLAGVVAMAIGAVALVEGVRQISGVEATQTKLGLTLVGFATAFELVVLAWSSAHRGISEAVVAAVVGSFAYNATMTLGAGALARPLVVSDATTLHLPFVLMVAAMLLVLSVSARGTINRTGALVLLGAYPLFLAAVVVV